MPKSNKKTKKSLWKHLTFRRSSRLKGNPGSHVEEVQTPNDGASVQAEHGTPPHFPIDETLHFERVSKSPSILDSDVVLQTPETKGETRLIPQDRTSNDAKATTGYSSSPAVDDDDDEPLIASLRASPPREVTELSTASSDNECTTPRSDPDTLLLAAVQETPPAFSPAPLLVSAKRLASEVRRSHSNKRRKRYLQPKAEGDTASKENHWNGLSEWTCTSSDDSDESRRSSSLDSDSGNEEDDALRNATGLEDFWRLCYGEEAPSMASWSARRVPPAKSCLSSKKKSPPSIMETPVNSHATPDRVTGLFTATPPAMPLKTPSPSPPDGIAGYEQSDEHNHHKTVHFGGTLATAEYDTQGPPQELTPLPEKRLSQEFRPPNEQDEALLAETKHNTATLAAWDSFEESDDDDEDIGTAKDDFQSSTSLESGLLSQRQPRRPSKARRQSGIFASPKDRALFLPNEDEECIEEQVVADMESLAVDSPPARAAVSRRQYGESHDHADSLDQPLVPLLRCLAGPQEAPSSESWLDTLEIPPIVARQLDKYLSRACRSITQKKYAPLAGPAAHHVAELKWELLQLSCVQSMGDCLLKDLKPRLASATRKMKKKVRKVQSLTERANVAEAAVRVLEREVEKARNARDAVSTKKDRIQSMPSVENRAQSRVMPFHINHASETMELCFSLPRIDANVTVQVCSGSIQCALDSNSSHGVDSTARDLLLALLCQDENVLRPSVQSCIDKQCEFRFAVAAMSQALGRMEMAACDLMTLTETQKRVKVERVSSGVVAVEVTLTDPLRVVFDYDCTRDAQLLPIPSTVTVFRGDSNDEVVTVQEQVRKLFELYARQIPSKFCMSVLHDVCAFVTDRVRDSDE